jgi:hypothetical protein
MSLAAFFRDYGMDMFTAVSLERNEWASNLCEDTHTATYVVIGDICLRYPDENSRGICSQRHIQAKAVLQTSIRFPGRLPLVGDFVRLKPVGNVFSVKSSSVTDDLYGTMILTHPPIGTRFPLLVNHAVGTEVLEDLPLQRRKRISAIIEAQTPSWGGLSDARQVVPRDRRRQRRRKRRLSPSRFSRCCVQ